MTDFIVAQQQHDKELVEINVQIFFFIVIRSLSEATRNRQMVLVIYKKKKLAGLILQAKAQWRANIISIK